MRTIFLSMSFRPEDSEKTRTLALPGREHAPLPPPLHDVQAISLTSDDAIDAVARQIKEAITTVDPPVSFQTETLAQAG